MDRKRELSMVTCDRFYSQCWKSFCLRIECCSHSWHEVRVVQGGCHSPTELSPRLLVMFMDMHPQGKAWLWHYRRMASLLTGEKCHAFRLLSVWEGDPIVSTFEHMLFNIKTICCCAPTEKQSDPQMTTVTFTCRDYIFSFLETALPACTVHIQAGSCTGGNPTKPQIFNFLHYNATTMCFRSIKM